MTRKEWWDAKREMREGLIVVVWDDPIGWGCKRAMTLPPMPWARVFDGTPVELVYREAEKFVAALRETPGVTNIRMVACDIPKDPEGHSHLCEHSFFYCYHHWNGDVCYHCGCTKEQAKTTYEFCFKKSETPMASCPQCPDGEEPPE
jgi:hypothetical protein